MHRVRPSIRAMEGAVDLADKTTVWSSAFWSQCLRATPCGPLKFQVPTSELKPGTTLPLVSSAYAQIIHHANEREPRQVWTRNMRLLLHGIVLARRRTGLARDRCRTADSWKSRSSNSFGMLCNTFHLAKQDSAGTWQSYRAYGAGQTKLAFLKLAESDGRLNQRFS